MISLRSRSLRQGSVVLLVVAAAFALGRASAGTSARAAVVPEAVAAPAAPLFAPLAGVARAPDPVCEPEKAPASRAERDAELQAALKKLDRMPGCERREDDRLALIEQWAAVNPQGALEYVRQNLKSDRQAQALSRVVTVWAKQDPATAWQWARSLGAGQSHHAHTVLEEVARNDPATAAAFAADFAREHPNDGVAMCLTAMRGMTYGGNFDAVQRFARDVKLATPEDQRVLLNFTAGQWARFDPVKTADWVQGLPEGAARDQALIGLGESWAESDPQHAADFAAGLPSGASRQTALKQAIGNWILDDPSAASNFINQVGRDPDFDQAVSSLATLHSLVEEHTDVAVNWASAISNEPLRLKTLGEVLSTLAVRDRAAALRYASSLPNISAEARSALMAQLH